MASDFIRLVSIPSYRVICSQCRIKFTKEDKAEAEELMKKHVETVHMNDITWDQLVDHMVESSTNGSRIQAEACLQEAIDTLKHFGYKGLP